MTAYHDPYRTRWVMRADVFGPSRCLAHFAGLGILPKVFEMRRTGADEVIVDMAFEPQEDSERLQRAFTKLATLPIMYPDQPQKQAI